MGQLAIVNAPSSFAFIWSVIRPWLSKETAEKVDILGSDYKDVLLKLVDADNLPSVLGGTCTCEDEGGCHLSGVGPWIEGRVGWGPKAKEQKGEVNGRKDGESETGVQRIDETVVASEARITPTEDGEKMDLETQEVVEKIEVDVDMKESRSKKVVDDIRVAAVPKFAGAQGRGCKSEGG
jgi:hypothetical protein